MADVMKKPPNVGVTVTQAFSSGWEARQSANAGQSTNSILGSGLISTQPMGSDMSWIVVQVGSDYLVASAPVTAVKIQEKADFNITKGISGDFIVSVFGDTPVSIEISGLSIHSNCSKMREKDLNAWYNTHRISKNLRNRVTVSVLGAASRKVQVYKCVLVSLALSGRSEEVPTKTNTYKMDLIGVGRGY